MVRFLPGADWSNWSVSSYAKISRILPKAVGSSETWPDLDMILPDSSSSGLISTDRTENGRFSFEFRPDLNRLDRKWAIFLRVQAGYQ